jgi:hypothetical protein
VVCCCCCCCCQQRSFQQNKSVERIGLKAAVVGRSPAPA